MNEEKLKMLIQSTAPSGVSTNLRERAVNAATKRRLPRFWSYGAGAATVGALVVVAVLGGSPKASATSLIDRTAAQADRLGSVHWIRYDLSRGNRKLTEGWYDHGKYRQEDVTETVVCLNHRFYRNAWGEKFVTSSDGRERPSLQSMGDFRASSLVRPAEASLQLQYKDGRTWTENGRHLSEIVVSQKWHDTERSVLTIDSDRDVLIKSTTQRLVNGQWEDVYRTDIDFGRSLPATTWQPQAFQGKPVVDLATLREDWQRKLQSTVATIPLPEAKIRIHNIWRNRQGWIFLLYTMDGTIGLNEMGLVKDPLVWMEDDRGVVYTRGIFEPSWSWNGEWQPAPLTVNGEKMQGFWMIPTRKTDARKLQLSIDDRQGGKRVRLGTIALNAPPSEPALTPPYCPVLSLYPFDANMASQMYAYAMQRWWHQRWVDAKGRAVPGLDDGNQVRAWGMFADNPMATPGAQLARNGKQKELEWTYTLLDFQAEKERNTNEHYNNGDEWYKAYLLENELGNKEAARKDLERAQARNPERNFQAVAR